MAKKRLGELLLERDLITSAQLNEALAYQRKWGHRLGAALVVRGFLSEGMLTRVLSESLRIPMVDLSKINTDARAIELIRASMAEEHEIFPLAIKQYKGRKTLLLAMADPLNVSAIDEVAFITDMTIRPAIAQISSLRAAVRRHYFHEDVDIPPLNFEKGSPQSQSTALPQESPMTITVGGSYEEREVGVVEHTSEGAPIEVTIDLVSEVDHEPRPDPRAQFTVGEPVPVGKPLAMSDPFAAFQHEAPPSVFSGQPTGAYMIMPPAPAASPSRASPAVPSTVLANDPAEELEKKFWALMRVLTKKGLITREEFLRELMGSDP